MIFTFIKSNFDSSGSSAHTFEVVYVDFSGYNVLDSGHPFDCLLVTVLTDPWENEIYNLTFVSILVVVFVGVVAHDIGRKMLQFCTLGLVFTFDWRLGWVVVSRWGSWNVCSWLVKSWYELRLLCCLWVVISLFPVSGEVNVGHWLLGRHSFFHFSEVICVDDFFRHWLVSSVISLVQNIWNLLVLLLSVWINTTKVGYLLHVVLSTPSGVTWHKFFLFVPFLSICCYVWILITENIWCQVESFLSFSVSVKFGIHSCLSGLELSCVLFSYWVEVRTSVKFFIFPLVSGWIIKCWRSGSFSSAQFSCEVSFPFISISVHCVSEKTFSSFIVSIEFGSLALFADRSTKHCAAPVFLISSLVCSSFIGVTILITSHDTWLGKCGWFSLSNFFMDHSRLLNDLTTHLVAEDIWILIRLSCSSWLEWLIYELSLSDTLSTIVVLLVSLWVFHIECCFMIVGNPWGRLFFVEEHFDLKIKIKLILNSGFIIIS